MDKILENTINEIKANNKAFMDMQNNDSLAALIHETLAILDAQGEPLEYIAKAIADDVVAYYDVKDRNECPHPESGTIKIDACLSCGSQEADDYIDFTNDSAKIPF